MDKVLSDKVVEEILSVRLPLTKTYQKCSYILPDGRFMKMYEHHEAHKFLVAEELCPCIPDAEHLLSDLGYLRYSWIGYMTLPDKQLTSAQYKSLELALMNIAKSREHISVQVHSQPRVYVNYPLDDIPYILERVKYFYKTGNLLI